MINQLKNMNLRERRLAGATLLIALSVGIFMLSGDPAEETGTTGARTMEDLQTDYGSKVDRINRAPTILRKHNEIVDKLPATSGETRPDFAFTDQLAKLCRDAGFPNAPITAPKVDEIKGISEYELVLATVTAEGTFNDAVRFLRILEDAGLIFRSVDIKSSIDRDQIRAEVVVSKIVPVPPRAARRGAARRGSSF